MSVSDSSAGGANVSGGLREAMGMTSPRYGPTPVVATSGLGRAKMARRAGLTQGHQAGVAAGRRGIDTHGTFMKQ